MLSTSAPANADHLLDLLGRVRHHRQRAERERRVRRLVHDDVVRDLVDERLALAQARRATLPAFIAAPFRLKTSTGPSPAPSSARPWATAAEAAAAAPRAACSSGSPRASKAASVAEWVQPAPCVAATAWRVDRDLDVARAVEEVVDGVLAVAAGDDDGGRAELVQPLGELAARRRRSRRARPPRAGSA